MMFRLGPLWVISGPDRNMLLGVAANALKLSRLRSLSRKKGPAAAGPRAAAMLGGILRSAANSRPPSAFHQDGNALQLDNAECDVQPDRARICQDRVTLLSDGL
jgi:hypothetical protein